MAQNVWIFGDCYFLEVFYRFITLKFEAIHVRNANNPTINSVTNLSFAGQGRTNNVQLTYIQNEDDFKN